MEEKKRAAEPCAELVLTCTCTTRQCREMRRRRRWFTNRCGVHHGERADAEGPFSVHGRDLEQLVPLHHTQKPHEEEVTAIVPAAQVMTFVCTCAADTVQLALTWCVLALTCRSTLAALELGGLNGG